MPDAGFFDPISGEMQLGKMYSPGYGKEFGKKPSPVKGRKKCKVCGKTPADMAAHFQAAQDTHGPISSHNPAARQHFPGLDELSQHLTGIYNDKRPVP